jgi:starch synthase (maltosyl-transferring)
MKEHTPMIIYNLFPTLAGTFADWEKHLVRAASMGFNWIFVNPIQQPGSSESLYSIADYFAFNPLLVDSTGRDSAEQQVRKIIRTARELNLNMMIDLVINHCSSDSKLLRSNPQWFLWEAPGKVVHPSCDENGTRVVWQDLAQFDHHHTRDREGLFLFFKKIVDFLIDIGFRGFRCDAAYQLPRDLWQRLIREIRAKHPDVLFFAETLGCLPDQTRETASAGFDYIFNSSKWWDFQGPWLMQQYHLTREVAPSISFPESHDTVRLCEELHGNVEGLKQRCLFSGLFSAGVMMPIGFEFGFRRKLHVVATRPSDWEESSIDLSPFITRVNSIKAQYDLFQEEAPTEVLHCDNPNVLFMWKASTRVKQECLIILNKDSTNKQYFHSDNLYHHVQSGAPLVDLSPEYHLDYIPTPFSYDLRPGQGIVLLTQRE